MKYRVIKDIPDGWETDSKVGDILTKGWWEGGTTLFKGKKAVCDANSTYGLEHCEPINDDN